MVTDGAGTPLAVEVTAGQVHESTWLESVVATFVTSRKRRRRRKPKKLAGDKAYRVRRVRDWLKAWGVEPGHPAQGQRARTARPGGGVRPRGVPPLRGGRAARRWLKECRRIGTRFEKLAVNFHGMLQLAMIWRYLKLLFSDSA